MKKVVVIGGGVAAKGFVNAMYDFHNDIESVVIRSNKRGPVPCGIPYAFGTLEDPNQNISSDQGFINNGVELLIDDVIEIDRKSKIITTKSNTQYAYDRLVLATGSLPVFPPFKGKDLKGIHVIEKDLDKVLALKSVIEQAQNIVIVGGGFIGVELADELKKLGKNISLVELAPTLLNVAFEPSISESIKNQLMDHDIQVLTGQAVKSFEGQDKVEKVLLDNGNLIDADLVFMSIGAYPNSALAKSCGLALDEKHAILVNEYQQTSDPNIFAIGDCAIKKDLFNDETSNIRLASIAAKESRVAALNLFDQNYPTEKGITNLFSTSVEDVYYAAAGLTQHECIKRGYDVIAISLETANRHPATLPDTKTVKGLFFFDRTDGILLGAQLVGEKEVANMINTLGVALHHQATAKDLLFYNFGTQPLGTAAPNKCIFHQAGQKALNQMGI